MGTKYEVNRNTGDITGTGTATLPAGHFTESLTISGVPVSTGTSGGVAGSFSYTHTQASPSTTWTIDHGLNTFTPQVIAYNAFNKVVGPDTASGVSLNQYQLTFNQSLTGKAFLTAAGTQTNLSGVGTLLASTVSGTRVQAGSGNLEVLTGYLDLTRSNVLNAISGTEIFIGRQGTGTAHSITYNIPVQNFHLFKIAGETMAYVSGGPGNATNPNGFLATGTVSGTDAKFGGNVGAQTGDFGRATVSGVPVPLLQGPTRWQSNSHLSNQAYTATAEVDVAGITGIPLPLGHFTSTNGRTYRASCQLAFNNGTPNNAQGVLSMYYGPNGTRGENTVVQGSYWVGASAGTMNSLGPWQFTVTSGTATKFGLGFSMVQNGTILAQGSPTWMLVELIG